jgi:hypothetical protein
MEAFEAEVIERLGVKLHGEENSRGDEKTRVHLYWRRRRLGREGD